MCRRGQIEISERELNGTCNSTCTYKSYFGPPKQGCTQIDNCRKKETGWKRFFAQCVPCICDCALSCSQSVSRHTVNHKWRNYWTDVMWAFCSAISAQILGIWLFKYCFKHEFVFFSASLAVCNIAAQTNYLHLSGCEEFPCLSQQRIWSVKDF